MRTNHTLGRGSCLCNMDPKLEDDATSFYFSRDKECACEERRNLKVPNLTTQLEAQIRNPDLTEAI